MASGTTQFYRRERKLSHVIFARALSPATTPLTISNITPLDERDSVSAPPALLTGRNAEEEAQAEIARSHALTCAWLKALEERAKAQWRALVGGH